MSTLKIDNVNLDALEKQRLSLVSAIASLRDIHENSNAAEDFCDNSKAVLEDLDGLQNMLDEWSDTRALDHNKVYTAFCCSAYEIGTIWISKITVGSKDSIETATLIARDICRTEWEVDSIEDIQCIGLAEGDITIIFWEDPA